MRKKIIISIFCLFLCSSIVFSQKKNTFDFVTVNDIVENIQTRFGKLESYTANFKIIITKAGKTTVQSGIIKSKNPNYLLVEFHSPRGQKIISNGKMMWIYIPSMNVVAEQDLKEDRGTVFSSGTKSGLQRLFSKYHYKFASKDQPITDKNGKKYYTLNLIQKESRSGYRTMDLWINEDFIIEKAVGTTSSNKKVIIEFSKIDLTKNYQKGMFKFDIPSNARVVKNPMLAEE